MKRSIIFIFAYHFAVALLAQGIVLGESSSFKIGRGATFYAGPNTTFNGVVTNEGTIISFSDLDFGTNRDVGSLRFVGNGDQNLSGDTLDVVDINVDSDGSNVVLLTDQVVVNGMLNVNQGVIQAEDELDLLVQGSSNGADGFVEGKLVGFTRGSDVTFPMGLNGSSNYVTLNNVSVANASTGAIIRVECQEPTAGSLAHEEDVEDISEAVEWVLTSINGVAAEVTLRINFSDVNLEGTRNIAARKREPAILALVPGDSLFRRLVTNTVSDLDISDVETPPTQGTIESSGRVAVGEEPVRLAIAWVPVLDGVEFFVPTAFSPNGVYEENRLFRPFFSGNAVNEVSMSVYNNLNAEMYSISMSEADIDLSLIGWDGRLPSSGQRAPGGVYYYTITVKHNGGQEQKVGSVLLME